MSKPERVVHQPRPTALSDPFHDNDPTSLAELLSKPDDRLDGIDYRVLFGPAMPARTFEEIVYFLPHALAYLRRDDDLIFEGLSSVVGWISGHAAELSAEGLLEPVRDDLRGLLDHWSREFIVVHFDGAACREKGWRLRHADHVARSDAVFQTVEDLVRYRTQADVGEEFVRDLSLNLRDPVKAAWFLEGARARLEGSVRFPKRSAIYGLVTDRALLEAARQCVAEKLVPNEPSPTYWDDLFGQLGL